METKVDISLFPVTAGINSLGHLTIAGHDLTALAQTYGTPLYLYDGATVRGQLDRLKTLFKQYYPGDAMIAYASKAYFSQSVAAKLAALGAGSDVVSLGEIRVAQRAGFPAEMIHLHGNNKTEAELRAALEWNIQAIVVDSLDELAFLETLAAEQKRSARIWLRITPDLNVNTHPHIETSHSDSKFGLHIQNGEAAEGIRRALASPWFKLAGLHTHLGSQIFDAGPYSQAIGMLFEVAAANNYIPTEISPGGGWGVRYTDADPSDDAEPWVRTVAEAVQEACNRHKWPLPRLVLEPGRWLVARAGVAVYSVGTQKTTPSGTHIVAIDGGLGDNPRVALYNAHYTARVVQRAAAAPTEKVRVVGKFCESGDVLIPEIILPPVERGDLLATPASGAYQLSMASNYNFAARPSALWLEEGSVEVMQSGELPDQPGWLVYQPDQVG
jgi:diaminopimelate decarboxylase